MCDPVQMEILHETGSSFSEGTTREIPSDCLCPITGEPMTDPVVAADGHSYERSAIFHWFSLGRTTSPKTNVPLCSKALIPNHSLRGVIQDLLPADVLLHLKKPQHVAETKGSRSFVIEGAGDSKVNGVYHPVGFHDGAPQYKGGESDSVTLLRYRFRNTGNAYWFLSLRDPGGKDALDRDLYRTAASEDHEPPKAWIAGSKKPTTHGAAPAPLLVYAEVQDVKLLPRPGRASKILKGIYAAMTR